MKTDLDCLDRRDEEVLSSSADYVLHHEVYVYVGFTGDEARNGAGVSIRLTDKRACYSASINNSCENPQAKYSLYSGSLITFLKWELLVVCPGSLH
jgi:hypothetical protein